MPHVSTFLLSGLAARYLGHIGAQAASLQGRGATTVQLLVAVRVRKGGLHENQLRESRARSCFG